MVLIKLVYILCAVVLPFILILYGFIKYGTSAESSYSKEFTFSH